MSVWVAVGCSVGTQDKNAVMSSFISSALAQAPGRVKGSRQLLCACSSCCGKVVYFTSRKSIPKLDTLLCN